MTRAKRAPLTVALAVLLAACGTSELPAVVDGWVVGLAAECPADSECATFLPVAARGLDRRDAAHAPIVRASLHEQGVVGQPNEHRLMACSGGCPLVAVFELADGSIRAIGVGTPGILTEPITFDYGPEPTP